MKYVNKLIMKGGEKQMYYVGMDIHKKRTYAIVKDREGNMRAQQEFTNSKKNFERFMKDFPPSETLVVIESTSIWEYIYNILEDLEYRVKLSNPYKTKLIAYARIKTDRIDAETLCDLLRADLIAECYIPNKEIRELREIARIRKTFVKIGTQLKNKIRANINKKGIKISTQKLGVQAIEKILKERENDLVLTSYITTLQDHQKNLDIVEKKISDIALKNHYAEILMTIPGIAEIRSLQIIAEIGDINRFESAEKLCSYAGLVPTIRQSGDTIKVGRLVKQASKNLKYVLIEASWNLIRESGKNRFREFYEKLSEKKGGQVAICAVARKLCCTIYAMLKKDQEFILL